MMDTEVERAAQSLWVAAVDSRPIPRITCTYDGMCIADAYAVQRALVGLRTAAGARVRGHKIGLTAPVIQKQFGMAEPDYGVLLDDMFVLEGADICASALIAPRVEAEVAFVLERPLCGPGVTVADVLRATAFVMPSLEVIDSRIVDWDITVIDSVADNASTGRVILGGRATLVDRIDPRLIGVVLRRNGELVETGASGAVLGNPVSAVAWLVNKLAQFDAEMEEGAVIMPGSCIRAIPVGRGDHVRADFDSIGHVEVCFS